MLCRKQQQPARAAYEKMAMRESAAKRGVRVIR